MDPYRQQPGAYPAGYTAPPPGYGPSPGYPPASTAMVYQTSPYRRPPGSGFTNCLCMLLLVTSITGCIVCVILFTIFLNANVPLIMMDSFSVSGLNASGSSVSGIWDIRMTIRNSDKHLHAYYYEVAVEITYDSDTIGYGRIPPFDQSTKSQDSKKVRVAAASSLLDSDTVTKLNSEKSKGSVKFEVKLKAQAWFKLEKFFFGRTAEVKAECEDLYVGIGSNSSDGSMTGGSKKCDVGLRRWTRHWWQRWW